MCYLAERKRREKIIKKEIIKVWLVRMTNNYSLILPACARWVVVISHEDNTKDGTLPTVRQFSRGHLQFLFNSIYLFQNVYPPRGDAVLQVRFTIQQPPDRSPMTLTNIRSQDQVRSQWLHTASKQIVVTLSNKVISCYVKKKVKTLKWE